MVVRDLRPQQILLDQDESPKLIHLGVMRSLLGTAESEPTEDGRVPFYASQVTHYQVYAAPEIFGRVVKGSSDIWSLGVTFLTLLQSPTERQVFVTDSVSTYQKPLFYGQTSTQILQSMIEVTDKDTLIKNRCLVNPLRRI